MSTLMLQGSIATLPDADVFRSVDRRVPLATSAESRPVTLTSDSAYVVDLSNIPGGVNVLQVEADFPVTVKLTSAAGTTQALPAEWLYLETRATPIMGISLTRAPGQATTVRLILGQGA